jgi:prepilin-type N-terminal cleavage/methylation domain-containing protein
MAKMRKGFTLIELLVMIAIIAILAAILFPVFAKARERAQVTACLNNMKQLGLGLQMYLGDYDGSFPVLRRVNVPAPYTWRESLYPYVKSVGVMSCPSNPFGARFPKTTAEGGHCPISYALNGSLFGSLDGDINVFRVVSVEKIKEPSQSVFVVESRNPSAELGPWLVSLEYGAAYGGPGHGRGFFFHHNGRINLVFCDTSAHSMKLYQTLEPEDYWHDRRISSAQRRSYADSILPEYR